MCYDDNARPPLPPVVGGAAQGEDLVLTAEDGNRFAAYLAGPEGEAHAGVLILPDVRGLHYFYKELAERFAEQGVTALALDYFGRTAGLSARDDSFEFMPHVQQLRFDALQQDIRAALLRLAETGPAGRRVCTVGFCMGGTLSLMTGTQDHDLRGVVGFYSGMTRDFGGGGTLLDRAAQIKVPVLALFGGADPSIPPDQVEAFDRELDTAGVEHEVVSYPDAPHSFFDRRAADFAAACDDAWTRVLGFIKAHAGQS